MLDTKVRAPAGPSCRIGARLALAGAAIACSAGYAHVERSGTPLSGGGV